MTQCQNTFLFNMKYICLLKMGNKTLLLLVLFYPETIRLLTECCVCVTMYRYLGGNPLDCDCYLFDTLDAVDTMSGLCASPQSAANISFGSPDKLKPTYYLQVSKDTFFCCKCNHPRMTTLKYNMFPSDEVIILFGVSVYH